MVKGRGQDEPRESGWSSAMRYRLLAYVATAAAATAQAGEPGPVGEHDQAVTTVGVTRRAGNSRLARCRQKSPSRSAFSGPLIDQDLVIRKPLSVKKSVHAEQSAWRPSELLMISDDGEHRQGAHPSRPGVSR